MGKPAMSVQWREAKHTAHAQTKHIYLHISWLRPSFKNWRLSPDEARNQNSYRNKHLQGFHDLGPCISWYRQYTHLDQESNPFPTVSSSKIVWLQPEIRPFSQAEKQSPWGKMKDSNAFRKATRLWCSVGGYFRFWDSYGSQVGVTVFDVIAVW